MSRNCRSKVGYSSKEASNSVKSATRRRERKTKPTKIKISRYEEEMALLNATEAEKAEKEKQITFQKGMDEFIMWFRKTRIDETLHLARAEFDLNQQPSADEDEDVEPTNEFAERVKDFDKRWMPVEMFCRYRGTYVEFFPRPKNGMGSGIHGP